MSGGSFGRERAAGVPAGARLASGGAAGEAFEALGGVGTLMEARMLNREPRPLPLAADQGRLRDLFARRT